MIDEVVCSDWETWKGWGSPQGGEGGGEQERIHRPVDLEGAPSSLSFLLGSRVKARAPWTRGPREAPHRPL